MYLSYEESLGEKLKEKMRKGKISVLKDKSGVFIVILKSGLAFHIHNNEPDFRVPKAIKYLLLDLQKIFVLAFLNNAEKFKEFCLPAAFADNMQKEVNSFLISSKADFLIVSKDFIEEFEVPEISEVINEEGVE